MCNKKRILYDNWTTISSVDGPRRKTREATRNSKALPKAKQEQKKSHSHWWSAAGLIHYNFLNSGETITSEKYAQQIHETHQKLQHLKPASVKRKGPIFLCNKTQPHSAQSILPPYSADHSSTDEHFFKHPNKFLKDKCFHNQQGENAFQEFVKSKSIDFYVTRINKLISHLKNVLIAIVPILINKDVFKPSYNDLKLMAWNCNYVCTNLINKLYFNKISF